MTVDSDIDDLFNVLEEKLLFDIKARIAWLTRGHLSFDVWKDLSRTEEWNNHAYNKTKFLEDYEKSHENRIT